jgi:oligosaccharyltransferase complex subunit alpha (ribophorin I)
MKLSRALAAALGALAALGVARGEVVNHSVKRSLDLTRHVVRETTEIRFSDAEAAVDEYRVAFPAHLGERLAHLAAKCGKTACEVVPVDGDDAATYAVVLEESVPRGQEFSLKLTAYYSRALTPFPAEITQRDEQLVVFEGSHVLRSPYKTETQTTKVKLPSGRVESFSQVEPVARKAGVITYGPYADVAPLAAPDRSLRVHYKNHSPFLTVSKLTREVEVSMWGRVSIEDVYDLEHSGAKLKGGFSRYDYQALHQKSASFYDLRALLPADAVNVYYRDQIGNVSTSRLRATPTHKELEFKPRFPLFGGWKTQFYFGYSVPTHSVLSRSGNAFKLEVDFSTPIEGAAVDDLTLKVILPEGATNVQVSLPFAVDGISDATRQTYLDTPVFGRPVVIIDKKNVVAAHNVPFEVTFDFPQTFMLHEPLLLISGFMAFFLVCMLLFRLDISLVGSPTPVAKKTKAE